VGWLVPLRHEDIPALPAGSYLLGTQGPQWAGEMRRDERGACVLLQDGLCTAYEARPRVCRDWPADCELYASDARKLLRT
jgi:Fe-S-cluster containining protein